MYLLIPRVYFASHVLRDDCPCTSTTKKVVVFRFIWNVGGCR